MGSWRSPSTALKADREHAGALFVPPPGWHTPYEFIAACDEPSRFIAFSVEAVPKLTQEGWQIAYSGDYPYRVAEGEAGWWADVGEGSGIDWFAFELGVDFEGHRINLVPHLLGLLERLPREVLATAGSDEAGRYVRQALRHPQALSHAARRPAAAAARRAAGADPQVARPAGRAARATGSSTAR